MVWRIGWGVTSELQRITSSGLLTSDVRSSSSRHNLCRAAYWRGEINIPPATPHHHTGIGESRFCVFKRRRIHKRQKSVYMYVEWVKEACPLLMREHMCVCMQTSDLWAATSPSPLKASLSHSPSFPKNCSYLPYKATLRLLISLLQAIGSKIAGAKRRGPGSHCHSDSATVILESKPQCGCSFFSSLFKTGTGGAALCCLLLPGAAWWLSPTCLPALTVPWSQQTIIPSPLEKFQEAPCGCPSRSQEWCGGHALDISSIDPPKCSQKAQPASEGPSASSTPGISFQKQ